MLLQELYPPPMALSNFYLSSLPVVVFCCRITTMISSDRRKRNVWYAPTYGAAIALVRLEYALARIARESSCTNGPRESDTVLSRERDYCGKH
ncbi:hypothetical protein BC832DRAFT_563459 [Gaertneriomyces semiglobifer]|nr:hypothetical protein BC832DRAFT_563459 [Gaertneriomyces semiglobifer]